MRGWGCLGWALLLPILCPEAEAAATFVGCRSYYLSNFARFLPVQASFSSKETAPSCLIKCKALGLDIAGLQLRQCFCGNSGNLGAASTRTDCNFRQCDGWDCGSFLGVAVYSDTAIGTLNITASGCYNDSGAGQYLGYVNSPTQCLSTCIDTGFAFAGVKFGGFCYCGTGTNMRSGSVNAASCTNTCFDGSSCGSSTHWTLYTSDQGIISLTSEGCYDNSWFFDSLSALTRTFIVNVPSFPNIPEFPERCLANCNARGFQYAGLDTYVFCFCGSAGSLTGKNQNASVCNADCLVKRGDGLKCGSTTALSRMAVFSNPNYVALSLNDNGCTNAATFARTIDPDNFPTPEYCASQCSAEGFPYAGANSQQCYCGTTTEFAARTVVSSGCSTVCKGKTTADTHRFCGGSGLINLYSIA